MPEIITVSLVSRFRYNIVSLDDAKVPAKLFKGWRDEVFIVEAALSREQVECLMRKNQLPTG